MKVSSKRSPRNVSDAAPTTNSYPIPAYLDFVPGGIDYDSKKSNHDDPTSPSTKRTNLYQLNYIAPDSLVSKAYAADDILRKYSIRYAAAKETNEGIKANDIPHRLPSLSILAEAVFGTLTGVHATSVRKWADEMTLAYLDDNHHQDEKSELEDILSAKDSDLILEFEQMINNAPPLSPSMRISSAPNSPTHHQKNDLVSVLKEMHQKQVIGDGMNSDALSPLPVRPCGYVFKRNDIAWNCRTCQTDSTCVLCDSCFHNSNHEGHEVYFHRTSPGGCCDCGDAEAWKIEGCCPEHRPKNTFGFDDHICGDVACEDESMANIETSISSLTDENLDFEAVKASLRGRVDGAACVTEMLPPRFAAALGVVIGAAVNTVIQAVDGAAIGADPVQWTRRWADQIRRLKDGKSYDEEYVMSIKSSCANSISEAMDLEFPNRFKLHLRLHNDDIHTYDEVIESLFARARRFNSPNTNNNEMSETDTTHGIVPTMDKASDLTTHVDSDGQVLVRSYSTMAGAKTGYERLKHFGLHCAIVSTPQTDLELRARVLLSWLSDISAAHPSVAALVVHALVDVTEGCDSLAGVYVWPNSRTIPPWSFTRRYFSSVRVSIHEEEDDEEDVDIFIPGWRRRMDVFPPNLKSSYLSREETRQLHNLGLNALNDLASPKKG